MTWISQSQYAKHRGCSRVYITTLLKKGKLPASVWKWSESGSKKRRLINPKKADAALLSNLDPNFRKKSESVKEASFDDLTFQQAKTLDAKYSAALKKLKLEVEKNKYILAEEVEKISFSAGLQFKEGSKSMIERVTPLMAAESDPFKVKQILMIEIRRMLQELSNNLKKMAKKEKKNKNSFKPDHH